MVPFSHDIYSFYVLSPARLFDAVQLFQLVKCKFCRRSQLWLNVAFSFSSWMLWLGRIWIKNLHAYGGAAEGAWLPFCYHSGAVWWWRFSVRCHLRLLDDGIPRNWNLNSFHIWDSKLKNVLAKTTREQSKLRPFKCSKATAWHAIHTPAPIDVELKYWWEFIAVLHDKSSPSHHHMANAEQRQSNRFTAI